MFCSIIKFSLHPKENMDEGEARNRKMWSPIRGSASTLIFKIGNAGCKQSPPSLHASLGI